MIHKMVFVFKLKIAQKRGLKRIQASKSKYHGFYLQWFEENVFQESLKHNLRALNRYLYSGHRFLVITMPIDHDHPEKTKHLFHPDDQPLKWNKSVIDLLDPNVEFPAVETRYDLSPITLSQADKYPGIKKALNNFKHDFQKYYKAAD